MIDAIRHDDERTLRLLLEKAAFEELWLYTLPNTSRLADLRRKLDSISNLRLRPKIRHPSKRQGSVWEDTPLWVAATRGDESVKLLLDNGANLKVRGACATTPLDMAMFEEHEAVVQLLLAANEDSNSDIEVIEDYEPGGSAEKVSTPRLHSDLDDIFKASQEVLQPPQPSQAPDNSDFEYLQPQKSQPLDSSTALSLTAQQQAHSLLPNSPTSPLFSSPPREECHGISVRRWFRTHHRPGRNAPRGQKPRQS